MVNITVTHWQGEKTRPSLQVL